MTNLAEEIRGTAEFDVRERPVAAGSVTGENRDIPHPLHGPASGPRYESAGRTQRYLLVLQVAVINLAAGALLGAAYLQGWVGAVLQADNTGLSVAIFLVFLVGLAVCARKIWAISRDLNCVRNFDPCRRSSATVYLAEVSGRGSGSRAITGSALRVRMSSRIAVVRHFANSLVLLGLIGTVLGFIIALSGVDPHAVSDLRAVTPMVTELIRGMSVALYTTLVGAVLNLWLMVNYHFLAAGATRLAADLIALGEANARHRLV